MKEIRIDDIIIEFEEPPRFFRFEPNKTYEVEIDLQRFPRLAKFKTRKGKEYIACVYNIRILKENEKAVNSGWLQRRIGVGEYNEEGDMKRVRPRMYSEMWQLTDIYRNFKAGIHKCIVKTREGNKRQVIARIIHSKNCDCLKNRKEGEEKWKGGEEASDVRVHHKEIAERLKEDVKEERAITVKEVMELYNTDEETARKALEILANEGLAVKIRENKYYIFPKSEQ